MKRGLPPECFETYLLDGIPTRLQLIVSGASSGIGAATAVEFAKHGVKVAINGRNAENLEKTAKSCYEAGLKETEVK